MHLDTFLEKMWHGSPKRGGAGGANIMEVLTVEFIGNT
jgi:hypothetical protein